MVAFCREVQKFISVCEELQSLLMQGGTLTFTEKGVVELSAKELLANLETSTCQKAGSLSSSHRRSAGE